MRPLAAASALGGSAVPCPVETDLPTDSPTSTSEPRPLVAVVFSKDRPLQLHAALASLLLRCTDPELMDVHVLYATSSAYQEGLYRQLSLEFPGVTFRKQQQFRADVLDLIGRAPFVAFVVDDALFVRDFSVRTVTEELASNGQAIGFSLRLGKNTTYCYPVDAGQDVPEFTSARPGVLAFRWPGASHDFGYPFDLSSSVYRTADIEPLLRRIPFTNPNLMEGRLAEGARASGRRRPMLLSYERSVAFCIPANLVQTVTKNRAGTRAAESPVALAAAFERGSRIDLRRYDDFPNTACHQEVELHLRAADPPPPTVSVVIPCYGQAEFLGDAVGSVVAQTWTDWEIVIVDDGSTDDTPQTARRLVEQYPRHRIRVLSQPNQGVSVARNNGIAASTGRYILPLDADDMIRPQMLEHTVALLEANHSVSVAFVDWQLIGASSPAYTAGPWDVESMCVVNRIPYCSLYRRGVWAITGGYNPEQKLWEDFDFWLACIERGVAAERVAEPLFLYRARPGTRTEDAQPRRAMLLRELARNHPALFTRRLRLRLLTGRVRRGLGRRARLSR
jgi:Glycosyl transferase family 2